MRDLWITITSVVIFILIYVALVHGEHTPSLRWMKDYKNSGGMGCCSEVDCKPSQVSIIEFGQEETRVLVNGVEFTMNTKSVHESEDGTAYRCTFYPEQVPSKANTVCIFYAIGS